MKNMSPHPEAERKVVKATIGPRFNTSIPWHSENRASYVVAARELQRFQIGENRVDIRCWPVVAGDGLLVGAVDRLMVEPSTQRVRYVAVSILADVGRNCGATIAGSVLVPVGMVERLDDRQAIVINDLTSNQLSNAPRLPGRAVMRADEDAALAAYGLPHSAELPATDFYKRPHFDETRIRVVQ